MMQKKNDREALEASFARIGRELGNLLTQIKKSGVALTPEELDKGFAWMSAQLQSTHAQAKLIRGASASEIFNFDKSVGFTGGTLMSHPVPLVGEAVTQRVVMPRPEPTAMSAGPTLADQKVVAIGRLIGSKEVLFDVPEKPRSIDLEDTESGVGFLDK
jgi:hypothetical protein